MIYLDLDDVCADLTGYINRVLGTNYAVGEGFKTAHWSELVRYHPRMFRDLEVNEPFMSAYRTITQTIDSRNIAFLTAVPLGYGQDFQYTIIDKIDWVREHFGTAHPVFFGPFPHEKHNHCRPNDLLIDDNLSNCQQWRARGGQSIVYRNDTFFDFWTEFNQLETP